MQISTSPSTAPNPVPQSHRPPAMAFPHLCSIPRGLNRSWWNILLSSFLWTTSKTLPSPSAFLKVTAQYLETHFTWNPRWSHLSRSPKNFQPGNTQPLHSPQHQEEQQKAKNKTTAQQRQGQIAAPRTTIFPNPDALMPV